MEFRDRYGAWGLIAGASMGIGAAFSHEAAARGLNLVMMARGKELLEQTAEEVRAKHGVDVRTLAADLADPDIGGIVAAATDDLELGLFVYNATVAPAGRFLDVPLDVHHLSVTVNCTALLTLVHQIAPRMIELGRGGIGIATSNGGVSGAINFSTYNAAKAYQWILSESLWAELGEHGIDVNSIFVGPTSSPNYNAFKETLDPALCGRPDSDDPLDRARARLMNPSDPREVAVALYDQLAEGPVCYTNVDDEFIGTASLALPRTESVAVWRGVQDTSTRTPDRQAR